MSDNVCEDFQKSKNHPQQQRSDEGDEDTNIENDQESPEQEDSNLIKSSNDLKRKNFQNQNQNSTKRSKKNSNNNNFNNHNQANIDEPETGPNNQNDDDDDATQNDDQTDNDDGDDVRDVDLPPRKRFKKHLLNQKNSGNSDQVGSSNNKQNNTSANNNNNSESIKVIDSSTSNNNNGSKKKIKTNQNIETLNKEENDAQIFTDKMEARFLVSSRDAGAIIGRGGSNITHLRQTYDSSVTVPDCLSPERVLTIAASVDKVAQIVREILKFLETTIPSGSSSSYGGTSSNYSRAPPPSSSTSASRYLGKGRKVSETRSFSCRDQNVAEIRLLLHTSHAGGLIGKGGSRITQLREETKAGIKIYSECCPQSTERVCAISGSIDIVTNAVALILTLLRTFPIKGPNHQYNPANFDPYLAMHYGGFGETSASPPQPPHPLHGGVEPNRNSIFTPPPIPPPPPAQYHHPTPPLHHHHHQHPHAHQHHHPHQNPFSSPGRLSTLNGPPSAMLDARTPPEFTSPAAAAAAAAFMSQWPSAAGSGRMPPPSAYARGSTQAAGSDMFASGDDPFRWITDAKHYDPSRLEHSLTKRDDVSIVYNPNGTAIATVRVDNKVVGAIIGRGGIRIKEIRIKTQAAISIETGKNNDGNGSTTRCITVKGLYNDVQTAVLMICHCIDENQSI